jgi:uncharacterized protein
MAGWAPGSGRARGHQGRLVQEVDLMKVRLEDIPPEGLEVEFTDGLVRPQDIGPQVAQVREFPRAHLFLKLRGEVVQVRGSYVAELDLVCSRCLRTMPWQASGDLEVAYRPQESVGGEEVHLGEGELEVGFFKNGEVDLAQAVRDELSLSLPMAPLCRDRCPGLCPVCGRLRDQGQCGCQKQETDPRWAKLAKLDLN